MRGEIPGANYYNFFIWLESELWYGNEEHFAGTGMYEKVLNYAFNQDWI